MSTTRVAVVQAASLLFDKKASLDKACRYILEAGNKGAKLVLLPEAFIPGYPRGLSFGMKTGSRSDEGRKLWNRYRDQSVEVYGPETRALAEAAKEAGCYVAIGVSERGATDSLYCSLLYFSPEGELLGKHRKLKPTGTERTFWAEGDGSTLPVFDSEAGRFGGLICWENYMPLARTAMYGKGVQIYLAPTADARESWQASMQHIACEGRCFVLASNQVMNEELLPEEFKKHPEIKGSKDFSSRGGSLIVDPYGNVLAGPLWDEEGILYAELDMDNLHQARLDFDVTGHYSRPDVFRLVVNEEPQDTVSFFGSDKEAK